MVGKLGRGNQIKMAYKYNFPNISANAQADEILVETTKAVPGLAPGLLFFVFCFVFLSGAIAQKLRLGKVDLPMWSVIASLSTVLTLLPLTLTKGILELEVYAVVIIVTLLSGVWLFLDKGRLEL